MGRKSKDYTEREKKQCRWFECIIYESDQPDLKLNRLPYFWDDFYWICHDQDTIDENDVAKWLMERELPLDFSGDSYLGETVPKIGDKKKLHYHIVVFSEAAKLLGLASTKLDIPSNRVQAIKNSKKMVRYLMHLDNPNKHKYGIEEVVTNNSAFLTKCCNEDDISMSDKARLILECIEQNYNCSMLFLCQRMIDLGVYDEYRRGQHLYTAIIYELREKDKLNNNNKI